MHLPRHVAWYLICFAVGSVLGLVPIWIVEVFEKTGDSLAATIVGIGREMEWVIVASAAYSFVGVESVTMLAEIFLRNREEAGRRKGRAEGRTEGRAEERQQIASRFADMTPEERLAEIDRLIEETRKTNGE